MTTRTTIIAFCLTALFSATACQDADEGKVEFGVRLPPSGEISDLIEEEKTALTGFELQGNLKNLTDTFYRFNRSTTNRDRNTLELETSMQALQMVAHRTLEEEGREEIRSLCLLLVRQFEKSLENLIGGVSGDEKKVRALIEGKPLTGDLAQKVNEFRAIGGDLMRHAVRAGLLETKGDDIEFAPGGKFFVRLAFKVRFANIFDETTMPLDWLLTDFEKKWYDIWVVERSKTASLPRRLVAIARIKKSQPDYKNLVARGIVYFKARKYDLALQAFEQATKKHPDDKRIKKFLRQAKRLATR